jgi:hypothetical protein
MTKWWTTPLSISTNSVQRIINRLRELDMLYSQYQSVELLGACDCGRGGKTFALVYTHCSTCNY